jgi:hypothetical protein
MAQEQAAAPKPAPWKKIFTGFSVALDPKKLLLAATGILCVAVGWWLLSCTFYYFRTMPQWKDYEPPAEKKEELTPSAWRYFKAKRNSWNLLHELAGSSAVKVDAADVADDFAEYKQLNEWLGAVQPTEYLGDPVTITLGKGDEIQLEIPTAKIVLTLKPADAAAKNAAAELEKAKLTVASVTWKEQKGEKAVNKIIVIKDAHFNAEGQFDKFKTLRGAGEDFEAIERTAKKSPAVQKALKTFRAHLLYAKIKPAGRLSTWPWFEERGQNPYLVLTDGIKTRGGSIVNCLCDLIPVVLEPLYKLILPIIYMFDARAGGWDRLYLVLVLMWTLIVWGFFGGAISRIAAVQVARNERITLAEAINFTRERFASFLAAPVFPLLLVAFFVILLMIFGWIEWIPWFGDIFAGLLWPIVILLGVLMGVVLAGLVGWPLMVATISTEGSDSFDALSRSYSYVFQAPWQYLWYSLVAVGYGAVLIFFVGFMASMMVYLGKWGVASAPGLADSNVKKDREPSYLFYYAPTSFGWRDAFISSNEHVVQVEKTLSTGETVKRYEFRPDYVEAMSGWNHAGAVLVAFWLWIMFLLVVGFGYSYFWSSATIVYMLMRRHVDDTEMDEVHLEDEDLTDPFMKPAAPPPPPPQQAKPGTLSLNVVEAPPFTAIKAEEPVPPPAPPPPPDEKPAMTTPLDPPPPSSAPDSNEPPAS